MNNFYDPWQHAIHLFMTRVMQFLFLSLILGLMTWASLLHWFFDASWPEVARFTWGMVRGADKTWRAICAQSFAIGALLTAWLFTWLTLRARLQIGDSHRRGSRVVHHEQD